MALSRSRARVSRTTRRRRCSSARTTRRDRRRPRQARARDRREDAGRAAWTFVTRARVDSSPAIAGGRVYVGSSDGKLYVLDAATGTEAVGIRRRRRDHRLPGHRRPDAWSSARRTAGSTASARAAGGLLSALFRCAWSPTATRITRSARRPSGLPPLRDGPRPPTSDLPALI